MLHLYTAASAAHKLNIQERQVARIAGKAGIKPVKIGPRTKFLLTETDLKKMEQFKPK